MTCIVGVVEMIILTRVMVNHHKYIDTGNQPVTAVPIGCLSLQYPLCGGVLAVIAELAIETFDECVLGRFTGLEDIALPVP